MFTNQRKTEEVRNHPLGVMIKPQFLLLHSLLRIMSTHTYAPTMIFKPPALEFKPQLVIWESSALTNMQSAGPLH